MKLFESVADIRSMVVQLHREGKRVALVPTMGALHRGHLALVREAGTRADAVIVSIFVNPTQFGPEEDFDRYPRPMKRDLEQLAALPSVTAVFAPTVEEMYPGRNGGEEPVALAVSRIDEVLCGRHRPGHFDGVTTVVAKLFNIVRPDVAVFGLKDAQQFVILRRMVRDLFFDVELVGVPTVREEDGLAMSSRNAYLTPTQRQQAVVLSRAVSTGVARIRRGEQRVSAIVTALRDAMAASDEVEIQYAEIVDADTLEPLQEIIPGRQVLVAVAAFVGQTRLIDSAFTTAPIFDDRDQSDA